MNTSNPSRPTSPLPPHSPKKLGDSPAEAKRRRLHPRGNPRGARCHRRDHRDRHSRHCEGAAERPASECRRHGQCRPVGHRRLSRPPGLPRHAARDGVGPHLRSGPALLLVDGHRGAGIRWPRRQGCRPWTTSCLRRASSIGRSACGSGAQKATVAAGAVPLTWSPATESFTNTTAPTVDYSNASRAECAICDGVNNAGA